jgi:hypothetical protein
MPTGGVEPVGDRGRLHQPCVSAANTRAIETGWGTSTYRCDTDLAHPPAWLYGAGGGDSRIFAEPRIRRLPGAARHVPDVAAVGDPQTGYLIGQTQAFRGELYDEYRIGGTSLSSPIFAGLMALADQASGSPRFDRCSTPTPGRRHVLSVKTAVARRNFNSVDASAGTSISADVHDYSVRRPSRPTPVGTT